MAYPQMNFFQKTFSGDDPWGQTQAMIQNKGFGQADTPQFGANIGNNVSGFMNDMVAKMTGNATTAQIGNSVRPAMYKPPGSESWMPTPAVSQTSAPAGQQLMASLIPKAAGAASAAGAGAAGAAAGGAGAAGAMAGL